jgi:hypothetical protein
MKVKLEIEIDTESEHDIKSIEELIDLLKQLAEHM